MTQSSRKRLLVAVDGSEAALQAVRYIGESLVPERVEIVLFHVMTKIPESFWDLEKEPAFQYRIANIEAWETQQESLIQEFMGEARRILMGAGVPEDAIQVNVQARKAGIARDIIAESFNRYDAVVVGRHGLSQLKDMVLGSVADKLIGKLVHVPVWVVSGVRPARKVLLPIDASEGAMQAVRYVGGMLSGSTRVNVTLFHAMRGLDVFMQGFGESFVLSHDRDWLARVDQELEAAQKEMDHAFDQARRVLVTAGLDADRIATKLVKGVSSRAGTIAEEARDNGYDTIVMGRRGLSRIQEFFMGRVSSKVIQMAKGLTVWVVS
jgi:nucleotide-binding universal stress UspA family protein